MEVLKLSNVTKYYKKRRVLNNINISISSGEIVGFVGPNGAGKTTTMKIIADLISPSSGKVSVCGFDMKKPKKEVFKHFAAIIENPPLYSYMSGYDNINYIRKLRKVDKSRMNEVIEFVGLTDRIHDKVKKYSLGMKQRLGLAVCLLSDLDLLLLDEPTNGLDPVGIMELRENLKKLASSKNTAILISSHNLAEIEKICDRTIYIANGEIVGTTDKVKNPIKSYKILLNDTNKAEQIATDLSFIKTV